MLKRSIYLFLVVLLAACTKDLEIDYNHVEPIPVVEAVLTTGGLSVKLTQTRDMEEPANTETIDNAKISLVRVGDYGYETPVFNRGDGLYSVAYEPEVGQTYTLDIEIDGTHYVASSEMKEKVEVLSAEFKIQEIFTQQVMTYEFVVNTPADEQAYYCYVTTRADTVYAWGTFRNMGSDNGQVTETISCFNLDDDPEEIDDNMLYDGDPVVTVFYTLTQENYDYLASVGMTSLTGANPDSQFTNGALGYFIATNIATTDVVYYEAP